jgi:hypothetical protein
MFLLAAACFGIHFMIFSLHLFQQIPQNVEPIDQTAIPEFLLLKLTRLSRITSSHFQCILVYVPGHHTGKPVHHPGYQLPIPTQHAHVLFPIQSVL